MIRVNRTRGEALEIAEAEWARTEEERRADIREDHWAKVKEEAFVHVAYERTDPLNGQYYPDGTPSSPGRSAWPECST